MTTITSTTVPTLADRLRTERRLRAVLGLNAVTSLVTGVVGLAAAGWWSDRLGIEDEQWTALVSGSLIVFGIAVATTAVTPPAHLRRWAVLVSAFDLAWVVGTIVVLATGGLTGTGVAVAVVLGVGVLGFAVAQLALSRAGARANRTR